MPYATLNDQQYKLGDVNHLLGDGSSTNNNALWAIEVDWFDSGSYSGENESMYAVGMTVERGRQNRWRIGDNGDYIGAQVPMVGHVTITLDNSNGRFTRTNTSSPLYGYLVPDKYIQISVTYKGVRHAIFHGNIKKISTDVATSKATIEAEDGTRLLYTKDANINITTDVLCPAAIESILSDIGWPSRFGSSITDLINAGYGGGMYGGAAVEWPIPYWWARGKAIDEIVKVADAGCGKFCVMADGSFSYISPAASGNYFPITIDAGNFDTYNFTDEKILKTSQAPDDFDEVRTTLRHKVNPLTLYTSVDLWKLETIPPIAAQTSITVWGAFTQNGIDCQGMNIITPVSTTDYTANAAADGSGADMTANISVSITVLGNTVKTVITNGHATDTAYITLMKVRGDALVAENKFSVDYQNELNTLDTLYGNRFIIVDSPFLQTYEKSAQSAVGYYNILNTSRNFLIQVSGRPELQFAPDIMSLVLFDFATFGASWSVPFPTFIQIGYIAWYIKHEWKSENGQDVLTTINIEPALYNY